MKNLWIVANWKSNKTMEEALEWLSIVGPKVEASEEIKVAVCPDFTSLAEMAKEIKVGNYQLILGSQDISPFDTGSYTGEEPAKILSQYISFSIIGHSERRKNFAETDEMVAQKVIQSNMQNIMPLLCVQDENTPVPPDCKVIAYEPIFAIGTGQADTPENASEVAGKLKLKYGDIQVLYGGSVTRENCKGFIQKENIDGLLIGKASLDGEEFLQIVNECKSRL